MRIYKGSEITLKLYTRINCQSIEADKMRVVLFTTNPNNSCIVNNIVVSGDTLLVTIGRNDLNAMEDGVINYIILGYDDNEEIYNSTRQSNYYLKTPDGYVAKSIQASKDVYIVDNGDYKILPDEDYSSIEEVNVHVEFDAEPYIQRGIELGEENQKSKLETISITNNGTYEREDGYNKIIVDVPDLNGSYDEGYSQGLQEGLSSGFIAGVEEQKSKLETITITENGTYTKEDGYNSIEVNVPDLNGSYDEGYSDGYLMGEDKGYDKGYIDGIEEGTSNAGEIIAQTAQVINITENGPYLTKYSDPYIPTDITGYFDDGTPFYGSAELVNTVFYTDIIGTADSYFEVWWKDLQNYSLDHSAIVGLKQNGCIFKVSKRNTGSDSFSAQYGKTSSNLKEYGFNYNMSDWTHIKFSREGLYINGGRMDFDFQFNFTNPNSAKFQINDVESGRYANGVFGMVKIDGQTFIPTEEGFKNYSTGEMLESNKEGSYKYIINDPIYGEGNLIKTVNVNVPPLLKTDKLNLSFGYSTFTKLPEKVVDWKNIKNMSNMFRECTNLNDFSDIDTSNVTNLYYAFASTKINDETFGKLDTSKVTNMSYAFYNCPNLVNISLIDTSNVTNMYGIFENSMNIEEVAPIDTSKVTDMRNMFYNFSSEHKLRKLPEFDCTNVTYISSMFSYYQDRMDYFTDCGGWKNLKINWDDNYGLRACANLSYQSCINILNGLADVTELGGRKLKVHQNFLDTVGDEISIGTSKNWTITA